jgi:hypothetical protein
VYNEEGSFVYEFEDFAVRSNRGSLSEVDDSDCGKVESDSEEEHNTDIFVQSSSAASNFHEVHMVVERGSEPI